MCFLKDNNTKLVLAITTVRQLFRANKIKLVQKRTEVKNTLEINKRENLCIINPFREIIKVKPTSAFTQVKEGFHNILLKVLRIPPI
jgi:hypothetical protein